MLWGLLWKIKFCNYILCCAYLWACSERWLQSSQLNKLYAILQCINSVPLTKIYETIHTLYSEDEHANTLYALIRSAATKQNENGISNCRSWWREAGGKVLEQTAEECSFFFLHRLLLTFSHLIWQICWTGRWATRPASFSRSPPFGLCTCVGTRGAQRRVVWRSPGWPLALQDRRISFKASTTSPRSAGWPNRTSLAVGSVAAASSGVRHESPRRAAICRKQAGAQRRSLSHRLR